MIWRKSSIGGARFLHERGLQRFGWIGKVLFGGEGFAGIGVGTMDLVFGFHFFFFWKVVSVKMEWASVGMGLVWRGWFRAAGIGIMEWTVKGCRFRVGNRQVWQGGIVITGKKVRDRTPGRTVSSRLLVFGSDELMQPLICNRKSQGIDWM